MKKIFNTEQVNFIKNNFDKMSYVEMSECELFKELTSKQIRNKARNLGIRKERTFNDEYFKEINSKEKAYFLGLIYADGYVSKNEFGISLHYKDKYILEKLNKEIGNVHIVKERKRKNSYNGYDYISHSGDFRVYSKKFCNNLRKQNICDNKTLKNIFPIIENKELFSHFLRGYFDGDGCLYLGKKNPVVHFTCGSYDFLEHLNKSIFDFYNVKGKIYSENSKKHRLMFYKKEDVLVILNKIYLDSKGLRLERKYNKYIQI